MQTRTSDYLDVENFAVLAKQADPAVALDFLLSVKNGIRNAAIALTEMANPTARTLVRKELELGIALHEELSSLMMEKGWLRPYDVKQQFLLDSQMAETTLTIAGMKLFPETTLGRKFEL